MRKSVIIIGIILIFFIILIFLIYKNYFLVDNKIITINHLETFDSSDGKIYTNTLKGDFRWESTGYQYTDGIGRIYGNWCNGNPRFGNCVTASMSVKIKEINLENVTKESCQLIRYGLDKEFNSNQNGSETDASMSYSIPVNDNDIICFSIDKNRDGIMGDEFIAIKIISHIDSNEGDYADSMTFEYKIL